MKEANWLVMQPVLAAFKDQLVANPQLLLSVLKYSPLPSQLISDLQHTTQQERMQNMNVAALTARINKDQANAEYFLAQAKKQENTALYDMAIAQHQFQKAQSDNDLTAAKAAHERVKALSGRVGERLIPPHRARSLASSQRSL
jgi:hypothetical protein